MMAKNQITIIGLAGGSCSGKTTLTYKLLEELGHDHCQLVLQDNYYIDQSHRFDRDGGSVNFDHPDSLELDLLARQLQLLKNGHNANCPLYDFVTHSRRQDVMPLLPQRFVLVDGTLILHHPATRALLDFKIFIHASEELRYARRLERDTQERGRTADGVYAQFYGQVKPMHDQFVAPSQQFADQQLDSLQIDSLLPSLKNKIKHL
jgi:uridine kinase